MSLSRYRAAQVAVGVLVVITIRSLAEFLRLYEHSATPLVLHAFGRHLFAIILTGTVIAGLFVYRIIVVT